MALHREQGGEETHATVNILRNRVWGPKSKKEQLRVLMKEHMALISLLFHGAVTDKNTNEKVTRQTVVNIKNGCRVRITSRA